MRFIKMDTRHTLGMATTFQLQRLVIFEKVDGNLSTL